MRGSAGLAAMLGAVALALTAGAASAAGRGAALVIGNNDYKNTGDLLNAGKDARDVAAALKEAGYEVIEAYDADLVAFNTALTRFGRAIDPGEPAIVFYAGHGVQGLSPGGGIDSYLVPVDADFPTPERIAAEAVALNDVLGRLEQSSAGPRVVILDACRENVFGRKWQSGARGLARLPGLASPQSEKLRGVFIAYATAPGDVAQDGKPGGNGLFTGALLKHLRTAGQSVNAMFSEVSAEVEQASGGVQQPWFSGSGTAGRLVLRPGGAAMATTAAATTPARASAAPTKLAVAPAVVLAPAPPRPSDPVQAFIEENKDTPGGRGEIARRYAYGDGGFPQNNGEAVRWARMAAETRDPTGAYVLGVGHMASKFGLKRNSALGRQYLNAAAEAGSSQAMYALGGTYFPLVVTLKGDFAEARRWWSLGAEAGDLDCINSLAMLYEMGWGGPKDLATAKALKDKLPPGYTPKSDAITRARPRA